MKKLFNSNALNNFYKAGQQINFIEWIGERNLLNIQSNGISGRDKADLYFIEYNVLKLDQLIALLSSILTLLSKLSFIMMTLFEISDFSVVACLHFSTHMYTENHCFFVCILWKLWPTKVRISLYNWVCCCLNGLIYISNKRIIYLQIVHWLST